MKRRVLIPVCVVAAVAVIALLWQAGFQRSDKYFWQDADDAVDELPGVTLTADAAVSSSAPSSEISLTLTNSSDQEISFLPGSVTLQKESEDGGSWMAWLKYSDFVQEDADSAEASTLSPGGSTTFSVPLTDAIPQELLTSGSYRFYLPFDYGAAEDRDELYMGGAAAAEVTVS